MLETVFNLYYLYLQHVAGAPAAPLIGFTGALMTLSKSMLYLLQEYYCGWCAVGHNNFWDLVLLWIIPNGCVALPSLSFQLRATADRS